MQFFSWAVYCVTAAQCIQSHKYRSRVFIYIKHLKKTVLSDKCFRNCWSLRLFMYNRLYKNNPVSSSCVGGRSLLMSKSQRRMASLVHADRKPTVTQINTFYNSGEQKVKHNLESWNAQHSKLWECHMTGRLDISIIKEGEPAFFYCYGLHYK